MARAETKLVSDKLSNCPDLMETVAEALGVAIRREDNDSVHRTCGCGSVDVFVTPTEDRDGFPGRQNFQLTIQLINPLSVKKEDIIRGCRFELSQEDN